MRKVNVCTTIWIARVRVTFHKIRPVGYDGKLMTQIQLDTLSDKMRNMIWLVQRLQVSQMLTAQQVNFSTYKKMG